MLKLFRSTSFLLLLLSSFFVLLLLVFHIIIPQRRMPVCWFIHDGKIQCILFIRRYMPIDRMMCVFVPFQGRTNERRRTTTKKKTNFTYYTVVKLQHWMRNMTKKPCRTILECTNKYHTHMHAQNKIECPLSSLFGLVCV